MLSFLEGSGNSYLLLNKMNLLTFRSIVVLNVNVWRARVPKKSFLSEWQVEPSLMNAKRHHLFCLSEEIHLKKEGSSL